MINRTVLDQVEEAIDCFEENWSPQSRAKIHALLEAYDLIDDYSALTELIRIDIELRYQHGEAIQLDDYFAEFTGLLDIPECISQIAFEDFRSRSARGHALARSRWEHLPGIKNETWFQQLASERRTSRAAAKIEKLTFQPDTAFSTALEATGFRLVHEIGQGALSRVYLATQNELADRYVVLKVVNQALAEPQSMAMLQHTNIVPIYSFHRILSRSVICMPYAGSVTLEQFLNDESSREARGGESLIVTVQNRVSDTTIVCVDNEPPPGAKHASSIPAADENAVLKPLEQLRSLGCNDLAIWIFQRLAAALVHSHARGVLHGDIKPANVLIRNDGEPALLDFNLSRSLNHQPAQYAGGTLPYMSPESYRALMRQDVAPNIASDIYGLGVMLFEFVTGRLPYAVPKAPAPIDLQLAIEERKNDPNWRADDAVSPSLRSIINRCLAFAPEDRYASADELQQDLECERQSLPLANASESRKIRIQKWVRRHPRLISSGSVALALLALMIPLGVAAVVARNQSLHMTATKSFDSFAKQSADALSTVMADPLRHEEPAVLAAMKPLEDFGVVDGSGLGQFESPKLLPEQRARQRDTLLRHVAQLAFAESDRLLPAFRQGPLDDDQLQRLDSLIAAADRIRGDYVSRACLFLKARRAHLAGDSVLTKSLAQQASKMELGSDSEVYLEAVRRMVTRDWVGARELLTTLADRNSIESGLRWTMLGRSQHNAGEFEDGKLSITQSIEHAPQSSRLWFLRGKCYVGLRKYERAESNYSRAIELEPTLIKAWFGRGRCRVAQGKVEDGIADFSKAIELSPGDAHMILIRREAYITLGLQSEADRDFAAVMKMDNLSAVSLHARAKALMNDEPERALEDLRKAHQLNPDIIQVLTLTARILSAKLERTEEAIEVLTRTIETDPDYESAVIDRAVLYAQLGHYDKADEDVDRALVVPNYPRTLFQAACALANFPDEKDHHRALEYLSRAIASGYKPDHSRRLVDDEDLVSLHGMNGFRAILRTHQLATAGRARRPNTIDNASE